MILSHPSIEKQICTFTIFFLVPVVIIIIGEGSSKALGLDVGRIEGIHKAVIEFEPFALVALDVADVMSHLCISDVADDA